jgi:dephospho-CoA kinase
MIRLGVTGGIGSGKSLVCALFAQLGAPVLSADDIAKEIMGRDGDVKWEIVRLLGEAAYRQDGSLDSHFIASMIFSNKSLQKKLNAIVHPRVERELDRQLAGLEKSGVKVAIVEAALIYEAGYDRRLDAVIVVDADERQRVRRVVERDKSSPADVRKRMNSQWEAARKLRKAGYVIHNDSSKEDLERTVRFLHTLFTHITLKRT